MDKVKHSMLCSSVKVDIMYLDVSLAVDVHVDKRAEPNQTLPHLHITLPRGQNSMLAQHEQHVFTWYISYFGNRSVGQ